MMPTSSRQSTCSQSFAKTTSNWSALCVALTNCAMSTAMSRRPASSKCGSTKPNVEFGSCLKRRGASVDFGRQLNINIAPLNRDRDSVRSIASIELGQYTAHVPFHGVLAYAEAVGDYLIGAAARDVPQHFKLSFGQRVVGRVLREF